MKPKLMLLDNSEIDSIMEAVRRILAEKGLRFTVNEIVSIFRKHGFEISDNDIVHIKPDELETALKSVPKTFVRKGGSPSRDIIIGEGWPKFAIGSVPIWIIENDPRIKRRPASYKDFINFTRLSENLDGYVIGNPVVQPQEIPVEVMHVLWNRNNAVRMTKPSCCWYGTSFKTSQEGLEVMSLAAGGLDELRSSKRWAITICPDSALQWGKSAIGAMVMADAEVPIDILPMPFLGSMYPVTMAGALIQSAVEVMGIVVLSQLIHPGCPVTYAASYGGIMDMAVGSHSFGAPESALFAAASAVVGKAYGLPTNMMQGTSDSKLPDEQAAFEKTLTYLLTALAEADCITMAGALLDFGLSASYEQLAIEDEIVRWVQRIIRGSPVNEATMATEDIMQLSVGGHYLESEHTLTHFKNELLLTKLSDRRSWEQWYSDGAKDIVKRAHEQVLQILSSSKPVQGIPENNQDAVDNFVSEVCHDHGVDPEPLLY
jgi:trimethylamine--corrinoid protein Co-methyltransferase